MLEMFIKAVSAEHSGYRAKRKVTKKRSKHGNGLNTVKKN